MARPRYPSDLERTRQRPHVKVHLSWMTHPHYAAAFADYEVRAIVLGVWMVAEQAHASATDDLVTLNPGLICSVTGRQQLRSALPALCRACASMQWTITRHVAGVTIHVRNFSKKQGFAPQLRGGVRVAPHDSASLRIPIPNTEEPKREEESEKDKSKIRPAMRRTDAPDALASPEHFHVLAWAADVLPNVPQGEIEARIEQALGYYRREGKRFVSWADAVIGNLSALENRERKRNGDPPLRSRAEARRLDRAVRAEIAAMDREAEEPLLALVRAP